MLLLLFGCGTLPFLKPLNVLDLAGDSVVSSTLEDGVVRINGERATLSDLIAVFLNGNGVQRKFGPGEPCFGDFLEALHPLELEAKAATLTI